MFIEGRAVTGLGFSGELAGCFAVVVHFPPLNKRPVFAGLMACVESLAPVSDVTVSTFLGKTLRGLSWGPSMKRRGYVFESCHRHNYFETPTDGSLCPG
jgi:hypothetical protein